MTSVTPDRELITTLSKTLVMQVAPEELDLFDELQQDYFQNPRPPDLNARPTDSALGFGLNELMVAVTPAATAVASTALAFLVRVVIQSAQDKGAEHIQKELKARLEKKDSTTEPLLNKTQLEQLKQATFATARQYGMNQTQAEQLTNAILVSLVLGSPPGSAPLRVKILFLAATPVDMELLDVDEEIRNIDNALRSSEYRDTFEIEQHWAVRIADIQELLLRHRPDIVHFSGHGSEKATLYFKGADGRLVPAPLSAFADLFRVLQDNVRCVVLNACYSLAQAEAIAEYIDCVVAMSDAMDDHSAVEFSAAFYQALAYGRQIQTAFELGINRILLLNGGGAQIPRLLVKTENARNLRFVE